MAQLKRKTQNTHNIYICTPTTCRKTISKKISIICLITTRCVLQTESKELSAPSTPEMCGMGFKKPTCDCVSLPVFILCNIYETNGKRRKQEAISVPNTSTGLAFLRGPSFFKTHTHILHCHECSSLHRSVRPAWSIQVSSQHFDSDPNLNGRKLKTNNISR